MNTLQTGLFQNFSLLTLPGRGSRGQHASKIQAARLLVRERKGMNGETDGIWFSCCRGRQRDGDTRRHAQRQLVTAAAVDGKAGPHLPWPLCSKACGLLRDRDPRHCLVHAGPRRRSSATTYGDLALLAQARHTPPCSGVKKGPCDLAGGLGWEQGYRHGSAWPWGFELQCKVGSKHCDPSQALC